MFYLGDSIIIVSCNKSFTPRNCTEMPAAVTFYLLKEPDIAAVLLN
jgi:hypothetical protein